MKSKNRCLLSLFTALLLALPAVVLAAAEAKPPQYFQLTKTLAQALVDDLPKSGPNVQCGLIHALLFDGKNHAVIASYKLNQVGEVDEEEDNIVTEEQCVIINPRVGDKIDRWNVRLPVKDSAGNVIKASWAIYFYRKPDDEMPKILAQAIAIRDELAKKIPSLAALFEPAPAR